MNSDNPQLGLRLVHADEIVGELYLEKGQRGIIGPYQVHLVSTKWWIGLDCANVQGIGFVFLGFFIIILGVCLTYFMPPREILVHAGDEVCVVSWYPGRFADFYTSELEDIVQSGKSSDH